MTNYYFDKDAAAGGNGLTEATAFNSATQFQLLQPGDVALLVGGATSLAPKIYTWVVQIGDTTHNDGTVANPITITTVPGQWVTFQPPSGSTDCIEFSGVNHWVLSGRNATDRYLKFDRNDLNGYAVDIRANSSNIRVEFIEAFDGNGDTHVRILGSSYNTIHNCKLYDNIRGVGLDAHGVLIKPDNGDIYGNVVEYCDIFNNWGDGVQFVTPTTSGLCVEHVVRYNDLYFFGTAANNAENCLDVKVGKYTRVYGNKMHGARYNDGTGGGTSIALGNLVVFHQNSDLENWIYENEFYDFSGFAVNATASDVKVYRNKVYSLVYEAGHLSDTDYRRAAFVAAGPDNIEFINNTIYGRHGTVGNVLGGRLSAIITWRNNICHSTGNINNSGITSITYDHNCWYNASQTLAGVGDVTTDPKFVNLGALDFSLQSTSPCIGAGVVYAPYTDGFPGGAPEMGAEWFTGEGGSTPSNVLVRSVQVACNTALGNQDITQADFLNGSIPVVAARFMLTRATADGVVTDDAALSWGIATGPSNQACLGIQMRDAQATTSTHNRQNNSQCVFLLQAGSTTRQAAASFVSFIAGGVRINWTTAPPVGYLLTVTLFGGTGLTAVAGTTDLGNTLDLQTDVTTPGATPTLLYTGCIHQVTASTEVRVSLGAVRFTGGVTQRCIVYRNIDASATVDAHVRQSTAYGVMNLTTTGTVQWGAEFASISNGFRATTRIAGASNTSLLWLALFVTGAQTYLGTLASPTATGNQSITAPGWRPQVVDYALTLAEAVDTSYSNDRADGWAIGTWGGSAQYSHAVGDDDAAVDSNTYCISNDQAIDVRDGTKTQMLAATLVSLDATGWTLNWSTTQGTARQGWVVAIEDPTLSAPVLEVPSAGNANVGLTWTAVPGAGGYLVKYGTSAGVYTTTVDVGNALNYTVTGLSNGTTYYFVVVAYAGASQSANSNERSATPSAPVGVASVVATIAPYSSGGGQLAGKYQIMLYTPTGTWLDGLEVERFTLARREMEMGSLTLNLDLTRYPYEMFKRDMVVTVERDGGYGAQLEGQTLWFVRGRKASKKKNQQLLQIRLEDGMTALKRRIVAAASGTDGARKTAQAGAMMIALMKEAYGALASTDRNVTAYLEIPDTANVGPTLRHSMAWDDVHPTLKAIARASEEAGTYLSFDVICTQQPTVNAGWKLGFRVYPEYRGSDHRYPSGNPAVILSAGNRNLTNIEVEEDWTEEANYVYAGGEGQEEERVIGETGAANISALSPLGRFEKFHDARQANQDEIEAEADNALRRGLTRPRVSGQLKQTDSTRWGRDVGFGDYVTVEAEGLRVDARLRAYGITFDRQGGEQIDVVTEA